MASHSSTLIDASSSSDTLPSALRQLTRTQQVIHDILKTEPIDTEPLLPIMQMQARELPSNLDQPIRTCCFDMSSQPPAWSAHKVCQRCKEINRIVQVPLPWRSRALFKVITSNAISTTDCISENVHKGKPTPELPQELFDMIVECAVEALRSGRDGMAVCKLMLTSCSIRYRLVRQFAPITIHEIDEGYATDLVDETVPLMYTYIIGAAQRYLVDSSEKRCSEHAPWQSPTNEEVATQLLSKLDGPISASVDLALDAVVFNGKLAHGPVVRQAECCFQRKGASVANILEAVDISFRELTHSFVKLDMALEESGELEHPAIMAPIVANPCQRALSGTFDAPSAHMHMSVAIFFRTGSKPHEILRKTWLLSTDISHEGSSAAASSSEDF